MLTLSYINTALSQSAFRVYKCYIINIYLTYFLMEEVFVHTILVFYYFEFKILENFVQNSREFLKIIKFPFINIKLIQIIYHLYFLLAPFGFFFIFILSCLLFFIVLFR